MRHVRCNLDLLDGLLAGGVAEELQRGDVSLHGLLGDLEHAYLGYRELAVGVVLEGHALQLVQLGIGTLERHVQHGLGDLLQLLLLAALLGGGLAGLRGSGPALLGRLVALRLDEVLVVHG